MKFKSVDWVRKIRDENYAKTKKMNPIEKIEYTKKIVQRFISKKEKIHSG
jgi:hypothetical protein